MIPKKPCTNTLLNIYPFDSDVLHAPIYSSTTLMQDLGHLGDTACAQDILDGTYIFSPYNDEWTIKILQEAHHLWMLLNNEPISISISIADFQGYWQRANEKISSSYTIVDYILDITRLEAFPRTYRHYTLPN
jgi:hypothetical protein